MVAYRLRVGGGARSGETTELVTGRVYVIGRGKEADLRFPEDPYMSRAHAELVTDGGGWLIRNKSQHGTFVAGGRVTAEKRLAPSDAVMVGGTLFVYELVDPGNQNKPWPVADGEVTIAPIRPDLAALRPDKGKTAPLAPAAAGAAAAAPVATPGAKPAAAGAPAAGAPVATPAAKPPATGDDDSADDTILPVVFLPGDSRELESEELARYALFEGLVANTIDSFLKKYKKAHQPPLWLRKFQPGEIICKEGDYGSTAFFVTKGKVFIGINAPPRKVEKSFVSKMLTSLNISASDDDDEDEEESRFIPVDAPVHLAYEQPVAELKEGDLFGEMSCMSFYPRSATCVAGPEGVEVLELLRSSLDFIRSQAKSAYKERIEKKYRERTLDVALRSVPVFAQLPENFVDILKPTISMVDFGPDTAIVKEGEEADAFYLVRLGFVKVVSKQKGGDVVLQYLGPGQYFGEIGLIKGGKRTASCVAMDHVELIKIQKKDFDLLVNKYPDLRTGLNKVADERIATQRKIMRSPGEMPLGLLSEKGIMNAQNLLVIDLDKCTRCDECVRACADQHDGLTRLVRDGLRVDKYLIATACRACTDPVCMIGCPVGSIRRRNSLEILIEDWCIGCGKCSQQCPYGNITMHPYTKMQKVEIEKDGKKIRTRMLAVVNGGKGRAVACDLCGGGIEPRCVYACPHDAAKRGHPIDLFSSSMHMTK